LRSESELIRRYLLALAVAGGVVALDLVTKRYASVHFVDDRLEIIPGFLSFTYTENPGAAFSLFQNAGPVMGIAAIVVTGFVLWTLRVDRHKLEVVALGFVIGGALGNLMDRVFRGDGLLDGPVIDWVDLWVIPTFNVADAAVTTAVVLLIVHAWLTE
jgi:signal peptidase II